MNAQTKRADYYDANESGNEAVLNEGGGSYASDQTGQNGFYRARVYAKPLPPAIKTDRFLRTVVTTAKFGNVLPIFALKLIYGFGVGARPGTTCASNPNANIRV